MDQFVDFIKESVNASEKVGQKIVLTIIVIVVALIVQRGARWIVNRFTDQEKIIHRVSRVVSAIAGVAAIIVVFLIWFNAFDSLLIVAVITGVIVLFAMRNLVVNLFASFYIRSQSPFKVGDRIEIEGVKGDVDSIGLFEFTLLEVQGWLDTHTPTGRTIYMPNAIIFEKPVANERGAFPYVWRNIELSISHESNLAKAEQILIDAGQRQTEILVATAKNDDHQSMTGKAEIYNADLEPSVSVDIDGSGVVLTLKFLCKYDEIAVTTSRLWKDVHARIMAVDDVAYSPDSLRVYKSEVRTDDAE